MPVQNIPQFLDDALTAHIPTFTAGELVRALLLVIAESNDRRPDPDFRVMLCVNCLDSALRGQRSLAFAWPDPDTAEEQNLIERLREACRRPRPPQPATTTTTTTSATQTVPSTNTIDPTTPPVVDAVAAGTIGTEDIGPLDVVPVDAIEAPVVVDTAASTLPVDSRSDTSVSPRSSPSPTSSAYTDFSPRRPLGCIYPLGPHDVDPNNRQYRPTERSFPSERLGAVYQASVGLDTPRLQRGRGHGAMGVRARPAQGSPQVAMSRDDSPANEYTV